MDEHQKIVEEINKAIKQGLDNAQIEWKRAALRVIYDVCTQNQEVSANDFTQLIKKLPQKTHDNRAIGGLIAMARKFRWIEKTGELEGSKSAHLVKIQVWRSLIYRPNTVMPGQQTMF